VIKLVCGQELVRLGIQTKEGMNISLFLDHLEECEKCRPVERVLVDALNQAIGGEKEY
jgi:hypothetical protein